MEKLEPIWYMLALVISLIVAISFSIMTAMSSTIRTEPIVYWFLGAVCVFIGVAIGSAVFLYDILYENKAKADVLKSEKESQLKIKELEVRLAELKKE